MKALTDAQVRAYRHDGYLFPVPALSRAEIEDSLAGLARFEARLGCKLTEADRKWRSAAYIHLPWANALVRHPRVLDAVEDVIGPDILVFTSTFFIKEPGTPEFAAWHQDATYFGLAPYEHVTAWVALSDASEQAGCMEVLSARGAPRQHKHAALRLAHSINGGGQAIVDPLDETGIVAMALPAGSFSLHHTLCAHRSAPNRAAHRRIGIGISYIPTRVKPVGSYRMPALLVRGTDTYGHFDLLESPAAEANEAALARHEQVYRRYRENYNEQVERHDRDFAA
jgi:ectoine hydroxylase-related dioxygenase (phytanoyl-CoA dioxygenase family)